MSNKELHKALKSKTSPFRGLYNKTHCHSLHRLMNVACSSGFSFTPAQLQYCAAYLDLECSK